MFGPIGVTDWNVVEFRDGDIDTGALGYEELEQRASVKHGTAIEKTSGGALIPSILTPIVILGH